MKSSENPNIKEWLLLEVQPNPARGTKGIISWTFFETELEAQHRAGVILSGHPGTREAIVLHAVAVGKTAPSPVIWEPVLK